MTVVVDLAHVPAIRPQDASQVPHAESNAAHTEQVDGGMAYRPDRVLWRLGQAQPVPPADTFCVYGFADVVRDQRPPVHLQFLQCLAHRQYKTQPPGHNYDSVPIEIIAG